MADKVLKMRSVDITQIGITVPEKSKSRYFSFISTLQMSQRGSPLFIQTPVITTRLEDGVIQLKSQQLILDAIDTHVIDYLAANSTAFFAGKRFSREKIASSFTATESGVVNDSTIIKDQRENLLSISEVSQYEDCKMIAILHIEGIEFQKNCIKIAVTIPQLKVYTPEKLNVWAIYQDSDDEEHLPTLGEPTGSERPIYYKGKGPEEPEGPEEHQTHGVGFIVDKEDLLLFSEEAH